MRPVVEAVADAVAALRALLRPSDLTENSGRAMLTFYERAVEQLMPVSTSICATRCEDWTSGVPAAGA